MFFETPAEKLLDQRWGGFLMTTHSSYFLAVLLIANPFMLLFFQNCSSGPQDLQRSVASSYGRVESLEKTEIVFKVDKNLKIK